MSTEFWFSFPFMDLTQVLVDFRLFGLAIAWLCYCAVVFSTVHLLIEQTCIHLLLNYWYLVSYVFIYLFSDSGHSFAYLFIKSCSYLTYDILNIWRAHWHITPPHKLRSICSFCCSAVSFKNSFFVSFSGSSEELVTHQKAERKKEHEDNREIFRWADWVAQKKTN